MWLLVLTVMQSTLLYAEDRVCGRSFATRSEVFARHGMAATSQPLATQTAIHILRQGGNAVDAAIAANAVLGLTEPTGCGIGGDLFAIVWNDADKKLYGLNASGRSPRTLTWDYFQKNQIKFIPPYGPLPVTVPGTVDGWFELHKKFGKMPMQDILAPAIQYAEEGFALTAVIAEGWSHNAKTLHTFSNFKKTFMPEGEAPQKGQIFKNPDLAATYRRLATLGRDEFYQGKLAGIIASYVQKQGGFLTLRDLGEHRSEWVDPVSTTYRGYRIWELPPNGQGIAALQILNMLESYDLQSLGFGSARAIHLFVEAKKLAFADRAKFYADPAFHTIPIEKLVSKSYSAERRKLIKDQAALSVEAGPVEGDTVYLTTADRHGNMVSMIQSNYRGMGSGLVPDGLGFGLQDRGQLFNVMDPKHANAYAPKKRPFHTIIPAFVTKNGRPWMSFGVMGGAAQPQMHVQVLINLIDFGMNLQEAGDAPRILHVGSSQPTGEVMTDGGTVYLESGFDPEAERDLILQGHKIGRTHPAYFGGYQAIRWDNQNRVYIGASESRKDGFAAGY